MSKPTFTPEEFEEAQKKNRVNKICREVAKLSEADFALVEIMAKEQAQYIHPLKGAKQARLNKSGKNNLKIISAIRSLKKTIGSNKPQ